MSNVYLTNKESTRVVFLIDVAMGRMLDTCERKTLGRAITLTSTRTLLSLSRFPHLRYKDTLKWNYTFYDSQQTDWSLRIRSRNFLELSTYQLESYSRDVFTRLDSSTVKSVKTTQPEANLLYNAMGAAIQDYPWDAPFIISPVRPSRSSQRSSKRLSNVEKEQSNILFIFNYCPTSEMDLRAFCGLKRTEPDITIDTIKSKLFTEDLRSSVTKNNVKIYFINCTDLAKQSKSKDMNGLLLYSEVVNKSVGGKVLQLLQFISPLSHNALHHCFSSLEFHDESQQQQSSSNNLQEGCHSSSVSEEEKRPLCTLTYPIQTTLSTVVSQGGAAAAAAATTNSTCLLEISDGSTLCILSVSPMLQDGLPLYRSDHQPSPSSSRDFREQEGTVEAVVIGVIRNTDINLSWLHPTKLYNVRSKGELDCSRYFQTLNLWLASNNRALIIKTKATGESALLQPITSLISSFIFVKPECVTTLYALPITSLAENKLVHTDDDTPHCSKHFSNDDNLFPVEADFCVNLDRLFSTTISDCGTRGSQPLLLQSFHPCSLCLPASNVINSEFYAELYQLAKREENNHRSSLRAFQESLYSTNEKHKSNDETIEPQQSTVCSEPAEVLGQAELISQFKSLYQQCVESDKNEEELFQSLTRAIKKLEDVLTNDELLQFLDQNLLSHSELRTKHEATQNATSEKRKINEYQLQALVYLEAHKRGLRDHVTVAEQLVLLLRGISLMTNTQFLSRYLTEIILANYLELCSDALRLLYEELMLPLPVQLSSPTLDTSYATSDGESPFRKPLVASSTVEDNASSRKLKRFKSFHGFPAAKKQITVPVEKKAKKAKEVKGNKYNSRSNRSTFRSVRSPFKPPPHNRIGGKNVRRSLFARSKSMMTISNRDTLVNSANSSQGTEHLASWVPTTVTMTTCLAEPSHHRGIKVDDIVCVQETPLKKQVSNYQQFKLQKRSKLGKASFPDINTIEESPYRVVHSISGNNTSCLLQDVGGNKNEVVSSSDEDDFTKTTDALLSLYLPPQTPPTNQENDVPSKDHPLEAPTDSMVAFRLTTPPKEARLDFLNVTSSLK